MRVRLLLVLFVAATGCRAYVGSVVVAGPFSHQEAARVVSVVHATASRFGFEPGRLPPSPVAAERQTLVWMTGPAPGIDLIGFAGPGRGEIRIRVRDLGNGDRTDTTGPVVDAMRDALDEAFPERLVEVEERTRLRMFAP